MILHKFHGFVLMSKEIYISVFIQVDTEWINQFLINKKKFFWLINCILLWNIVSWWRPSWWPRPNPLGMRTHWMVFWGWKCKSYAMAFTVCRSQPNWTPIGDFGVTRPLPSSISLGRMMEDNEPKHTFRSALKCQESIVMPKTYMFKLCILKETQLTHCCYVNAGLGVQLQLPRNSAAYKHGRGRLSTRPAYSSLWLLIRHTWTHILDFFFFFLPIVKIKSFCVHLHPSQLHVCFMFYVPVGSWWDVPIILRLTLKTLFYQTIYKLLAKGFPYLLDNFSLIV